MYILQSGSYERIMAHTTRIPYNWVSRHIFQKVAKDYYYESINTFACHQSNNKSSIKNQNPRKVIYDNNYLKNNKRRIREERFREASLFILYS